MKKKFHFITGLPRSGSTLLSSILKQNPKFHASITDPLANLFKGVIEVSQEGPGMKYEVPEKRRFNIAKSIFDGYYQDVDKPVIFNTNRAWTILTPQIDAIFPESKLIICVRDIVWILDSFELAHRKNPLSISTVTGGLSGTVYSRADGLMLETGVVGFPYIGVKQAITSSEKHKCIIIEYDNLCKNPELVVKSIYNFIDEPYYKHDFNNVEASWDEYDSEIGIKLHHVKKMFNTQKEKQFFLPTLFKNIKIWKFGDFNNYRI